MDKMDFAAYPWGRWMKWIVTGVIAFILIISFVSTNNKLVSAEQEVEGSWSQVENVMQARADKLVNMVEIAKGYIKHEEKVFGEIAAARAAFTAGGADIEKKLVADEQLTQATKSILLLVENYPDLKANQQFHDLQVAVEGAENRVTVERMRFIDAVKVYNLITRRFPGSVLARLLGFAPKDYFEAAPGSETAPKIQF
ncbi:MAG: LemA family protein [Clostridiales bacterium]|nr:LemA family protein [Clostridiales bacterium]